MPYQVFFLTNGGNELYYDVRRNSLEEAINLCLDSGLQGIVSEVKAIFRNPGAVTKIKESKLCLLTYGKLKYVLSPLCLIFLMNNKLVLVILCRISLNRLSNVSAVRFEVFRGKNIVTQTEAHLDKLMGLGHLHFELI